MSATGHQTLRCGWTPLAIVLLAAACACAQTQMGWTRLSCLDPAFSVEAPAGWRLEAVPGHGARLIPPDDGPVVEVVTWSALHLPATAEKAAAEHEGVLGRAVEYRRRTTEEIETAAGPALVVIGEAAALGVQETSIFCAYGADGAHWILGTFAPPEEVERLRTAVLDRMMRSFRAGGRPPKHLVPETPGPVTPPPAPGPPQPVTPPPVTETPAIAEAPGPAPAPATAAGPVPMEEEEVAGPAGTPVPPVVTAPTSAAAAPPEVGPAAGAAALPHRSSETPLPPEVSEPRTRWVTYADPTGFALDLPTGWAARVSAGVIVVTPAPATVTGRPTGSSAAPSLRGADGIRRAVIIWPVSGPDPGAGAALRAVLARIGRFELAGPPVSAGAVNGTALLIASTTEGERVTATWAWAAEDGLLVALVAPAAHPDRRAGVMARIAASFRPGVWPVPSVEQYRRVVGDGGELTWKLPIGWRERGGARDDDGDLAIDIEAQSADGALRVSWQQPLRPSFRALTPLLVSLGWHEGESYSAPETGRSLLIYGRRTPEELVRDLLLPRDPSPLQGVRIDPQPPSSAVSGLLAGDEPMGQAVMVQGEAATGPRERLYLVATARARLPLTTTCWEGAVLCADAPAGMLPQAVSVLMRMVESAEVTRGANTSLHELIERARRALADTPETLRHEVGNDGLTSVIKQQAPGPVRAWAPPAGALQYWTDQAASGRLLEEQDEGGPDDAEDGGM